MSDIIDRFTEALGDRYVIERQLGEGGMAIVYLAHDVKHDRQVALKLLRPELAAALGGERFLREIQLTAKLTHPHIVPLYDSGEADGFLYYVMPFIEGESLADLLKREGQLGLNEALQIAREVAEALGYAHHLGLVHRDIKPQNIMLSAGHAVVADFGIARAVSEAGGEKLTATGMAVGTPDYMSPEQAVGDEHVDGRSDVYSLGCVLYEMLVGEPPFTGPTAQAIMARHSMEQVPSPAIIRQSIPEDLEEVVYCALEKVPADRFHSATEMAEALKAITTGEVPHLSHSGFTYARHRVHGRKPSRTVPLGALVGMVALIGAVALMWRLWPSGTPPTLTGGLDPSNIAVLYFEDLTTDGSLQYLADGFTEGLIDELSRVNALDVVSRNGVAQFRDGTASRDSIARTLDVGTLIEGSVEHVGDRLRVAVRFADGNSGVDFERAAFELSAGDPLAVQDSVAEEVSRTLRERLGEEIQRRRRRAATASVDAWSMVQRGERGLKDAESLVEVDDLDAAWQAFDRADSVLVEAETADPQWAEPVASRAWIAYRRARLGADPDEMVAWIGRGMEHAERALALDPNYGYALELRGTLQYFHFIIGVASNEADSDRLVANARADLEAAVDIDPSLASAYGTLSHLYFRVDDDAVSGLLAARRAYEADAYLASAPDILTRLFFGSYDVEQFRQAQRWCAEGNRRFPGNFRFNECQLWMMTTPAVDPDVDEAWRLLGVVDSLTPEPVRDFQHHRAMMIVGGVIGRAGLGDSARGVLTDARADFETDPAQELPFIEAFMRTLADDDDEAIKLLKVYLTAGEGPQDPQEATGELYWWWRGLQNHPQFAQVESIVR